MKSKVDFLRERLLDILTNDEPLVVSLNGEWGVGKTYFWNQFVNNTPIRDKKTMIQKEICYVSLFGKNNIQDIRTEIILQISKKDEYIKKSKDWFSGIKSSIGFKDDDINLGLTGSMISSLLTLFSKKDFQNIIICFDDFERLSEDLNEKDILGLISEFKEQKNCKVVMIYNHNQIDEKSKLSDYKDKTIDYELNYLPTPKESYDLVKEKLNCFKSYPLEYFEKHNINNIRVIRRVINSLNDFLFIEDSLKGYSLLEKEVFENIIELSTINSMFHFRDFQKLKDYSFKQRMKNSSSYGNQEITINEKYEEYLKYINTGGSYFFISDITNCMIEYLNTSIVNKDKLIKIIEDKKRTHNGEEIRQKVFDLNDKFSFDMKYLTKDYIVDLFKILEENKSNILDCIGSNNFIYYIELLEELDPINQKKYHMFGVDVLKVKLDFFIENYTKIHGFDRDEFDRIQNFDENFETYVSTELEKKKDYRLSDIKEVIKLIDNPVKNRSWGEEPKLLSLLEKNVIRQYVLESQDFVGSCFSLIRFIGKDSDSDFQPFFKNFFDVLEELKSENDDFKIKVNKLLKYFVK